MPQKSSGGFTLIEILIAVLVLSVGVLGLISMESLALRSNQTAYHRSQATILAYDLADRIRANRGELSSTYETSFPEGAAPSSVASCSGVSTACDSVALAQDDLYQWYQKVEKVLPSVSLSVTSLSPNVTIELQWDGDRSGTIDEKDPVFSTTFRP